MPYTGRYPVKMHQLHAQIGLEKRKGPGHARQVPRSSFELPNHRVFYTGVNQAASNNRTLIARGRRFIIVERNDGWRGVCVWPATLALRTRTGLNMHRRTGSVLVFACLLSYIFHSRVDLRLRAHAPSWIVPLAVSSRSFAWNKPSGGTASTVDLAAAGPLLPSPSHVSSACPGATTEPRLINRRQSVAKTL